MRHGFLLLLIALCAARALAQTEEPKSAGPRDAARTREAGARPAIAALRDRIPEINFQEAPLADVFDFLATITHVNIVVRWERLRAYGIERDLPVTLKVKNLRLGQILWLVLNESGMADVKLGYRADNSMILVSSGDDLGSEMVTRVYDVQDLIMPRLANPSISVSRERTFVRSVVPAVAAGAVGVAPVTDVIASGSDMELEDAAGDYYEENDGQSGQADVDEIRERHMAQLIASIIAAIEPDSWTVNGGQGSIVAFRGRLVVRNTPAVHQNLAGPPRD